MVFVDYNGNFPFLPQIIGGSIGAIIGGGSKIISNIKNGDSWYDGVGKATLSGAVSGVISTLPIPGAGPLTNAVITGGLSNIAGDFINGDVNSFEDVAFSFGKGAISGAVSYGISDKIYSSKALKERDKLLQGMSKNQRSKYPTAVGVYDAKLGRIASDFSGNIPNKISGSLVKRANRIGGIGSKGLTPNNIVGRCAEFRSANTLMSRGSQINNIRFTSAVRPRTGEVVPTCKNCKSIFKEAFR